MLKITLIYRAYRYPYDWAPQAERAKEIIVPRIDNSRFRVSGSPRSLKERAVNIKV